jgi:hypothetical protein
MRPVPIGLVDHDNTDLGVDFTPGISYISKFGSFAIEAGVEKC